MRFLETSIRCPACSAKFPLREGMIDQEIQAISDLAAVIGSPDWKLMQPYLSCFRTDNGKGIRPEKALRLVRELAEIWRTKTFTYDGKTRTVTTTALRAALDVMAAKSDKLIALENHNYFYSVLKNKMEQVNAAEAKAEHNEIQRDKSGASRQEEQPASPEVLAEIERMRLEREAKLTPVERAAAVRKRAGDRPVSPTNTVDREQAEKTAREDLEKRGWAPEQIDAKLGKRGRS